MDANAAANGSAKPSIVGAENATNFTIDTGVSSPSDNGLIAANTLITATSTTQATTASFTSSHKM